MSDKKGSILWPLLSTILGGVLAILGGVVAASYTGRAELSLEREKYERERLEKAYLLLLEADDWAKLEMHRAASERRWEELDDVKDATREAIMLIRLYAPELTPYTEKVVSARAEFKSKLFIYWQVIDEPSNQIAQANAPASPGERGIDELRSAKIASDSFKHQVQAILLKLESCVHERMGMKPANSGVAADG